MDVTNINLLIGIVTTLHKFQNDQGKDIFLPSVSYHSTQTYVQLFYPQIYHQMHGGHSSLNGDAVEMHFKGNRVVIPIRREQSNPLILYNYFVSSKEKKEVGPHTHSTMDYSNLSNLDFFGDLQTLIEMANGKRGFEIIINNKYKHYTQFCGTCVGASENQNLYNA